MNWLWAVATRDQSFQDENLIDNPLSPEFVKITSNRGDSTWQKLLAVCQHASTPSSVKSKGTPPASLAGCGATQLKSAQWEGSRKDVIVLLGNWRAALFLLCTHLLRRTLQPPCTQRQKAGWGWVPWILECRRKKFPSVPVVAFVVSLLRSWACASANACAAEAVPSLLLLDPEQPPAPHSPPEAQDLRK